MSLGAKIKPTLIGKTAEQFLARLDTSARKTMTRAPIGRVKEREAGLANLGKSKYGISLNAQNKQKHERMKTRRTTYEQDTTEEMIKKHCGAWKDSRSAEEIIEDIMTSRTGAKDPLNFD